jgi:hypothetical protein
MFDVHESKPTTSRAQQWSGTLAGATQIIRYVRDELPSLPPVLYIGVGEEHPLRRDDEREPAPRTGGKLRPVRADAPAFMVIPTLEGDMRADPTDWIIRGLIDEVYPCKHEVFDRKYQRASTATIDDGEIRLTLRRGLRVHDVTFRMPYEADRSQAHYVIADMAQQTLDAAYGKGE